MRARLTVARFKAFEAVAESLSCAPLIIDYFLHSGPCHVAKKNFNSDSQVLVERLGSVA